MFCAGLNSFIKKLDQRTEKASSTGGFTLKRRVESSPSTITLPVNAPSWAVQPTHRPNTQPAAANQGTPEVHVAAPRSNKTPSRGARANKTRIEDIQEELDLTSSSSECVFSGSDLSENEEGITQTTY